MTPVQILTPPTYVQEDDIVSVSESGAWTVSMPAPLDAHKSELEHLINKVFANRLQSEDNIALAKQMSLNWCVSKCKQVGLPPDECIQVFADGAR
ncbi:MAG: hypothetical protein K2Z81_14300 [Cyanobacteria bacterium]|nr:hypothetical protein [Cyanobacteriota bacterium]